MPKSNVQLLVHPDDPVQTCLLYFFFSAVSDYHRAGLEPALHHLWEARSRPRCRTPQRKYARYLSTTSWKLKLSSNRNSWVIREMKWVLTISPGSALISFMPACIETGPMQRASLWTQSNFLVEMRAPRTRTSWQHQGKPNEHRHNTHKHGVDGKDTGSPNATAPTQPKMHPQDACWDARTYTVLHVPYEEVARSLMWVVIVKTVVLFWLWNAQPKPWTSTLHQSSQQPKWQDRPAAPSPDSCTSVWKRKWTWSRDQNSTNWAPRELQWHAPPQRRNQCLDAKAETQEIKSRSADPLIVQQGVSVWMQRKLQWRTHQATEHPRLKVGLKRKTRSVTRSDKSTPISSFQLFQTTDIHHGNAATMRRPSRHKSQHAHNMRNNFNVMLKTWYTSL